LLFGLNVRALRLLVADFFDTMIGLEVEPKIPTLPIGIGFWI
jgi:hypothetical protein